MGRCKESRRAWENPAALALGARLREGPISLERLLEPIVAEAAAASESWTVRIDPVVARLRSLDDSLREHRARGEREERQSCDNGLHFRSPSFVWCACGVRRPREVGVSWE
jgi:hypothetical protein